MIRARVRRPRVYTIIIYACGYDTLYLCIINIKLPPVTRRRGRRRHRTPSSYAVVTVVVVLQTTVTSLPPPPPQSVLDNVKVTAGIFQTNFHTIILIVSVFLEKINKYYTAVRTLRLIKFIRFLCVFALNNSMRKSNLVSM